LIIVPARADVAKTTKAKISSDEMYFISISKLELLFAISQPVNHRH